MKLHRIAVIVPTVVAVVVASAATAAATASDRPDHPGLAVAVRRGVEPRTTTTTGGPALDTLIGHRPRTLRVGTPAAAGLLGQYADRIPADAAAGVTPADSSTIALYPGEVVLAARNGVIAEQAASGYNLRYADAGGAQLPREEWIRTTKDTIYDLASLSKLFTSIVAVQLIQAGRLDLDRTVASYLPAYAENGKQDITIRQLLTHTSGLPPDPSPALWTYPSYAQRIDAIYAQQPDAAAGSEYVYSDLNMMSLQLVVQQITGRSLDTLVHDKITAPLGMIDTMYNPPASLRPRIAAEEYQKVPDRGLVWGSVHDENSWALGGVAGHAGVFSTAKDLAILAQTILNGGRYGSARILSKASVLSLLTNFNQSFPGNDHGLGFELYQHWYMGALATPYTAGHTGFTGTSMVIDPTTQSFVILLSNRVHPNRNGPSTNPPRRQVADDLARAVRVRPQTGRDAWYGGMADAATATLSVPLTVPAGRPAQLSFDLYYDTEPASDYLHLEASRDDGATWSSVPFRVRGRGLDQRTDGSVSGYEGRQWLRAGADLSGWQGAVRLRWRYTTDPLYHGRGVYVDSVTVRSGRAVVFDGERGRDAAAFDSAGWVRSPN